MIHVMIPACGQDQRFLDAYWPKNVTEVCGKVMMQYVIENFASVPDKRFVVLLDQKECLKFHTDSTVKLLTDGDAEILRLAGPTGGALCTSLMAIESINDENELLISNNDHKCDFDMNGILEHFRAKQADCGVVCFDSVHPRWSYVRMEGERVVEAAEKRPISRLAIAGLYYFRRGKDFIRAAESALLKQSDYEGRYYLSEAINEMILLNKTVVCEQIPKEQYHTFYEPKQIEKYEQVKR